MRRFCTRLIRAILLTSALLPVGCLPVVSHGPQVQLGHSAGITTGIEYRTPDSLRAWSDYLLPVVNINWNYGWRSQPDDAGVQIGLHLPVITVAGGYAAVMGLQGDFYYQFPTSLTRSTTMGVGVNASWFHVMPYLQVGRIGQNGAGWYTTQGFAWKGEAGVHEDWEIVKAFYWVPVIAYQQPRSRSTRHWFLSAQLARYSDASSGTEETWVSMNAGVVLLLHRKR